MGQAERRIEAGYQKVVLAGYVVAVETVEALARGLSDSLGRSRDNNGSLPLPPCFEGWGGVSEIMNSRVPYMLNVEPKVVIRFVAGAADGFEFTVPVAKIAPFVSVGPSATYERVPSDGEMICYRFADSTPQPT